MSENDRPRPRLLIQIVLLLLALGGWSAFAAALLGLVQAERRAVEAQAVADQVREQATAALEQQNGVIRLLTHRNGLLQSRVMDLEGRLDRP